MIASCKKKENKNPGMISGKLSNAANTSIYLARFDEKGEYLLDSTKTDDEGNFKMDNKAVEKDYYVLRTDPKNIIFLLIKAGESVEVTGDAKNVENTVTIKGSEDSQLIRELKKYDKNLSDSLFVIYTGYRDHRPELKDSMGVVMQRYFADRMEKYAKDFITKHPKSLVSLSAVMYLNQEQDLQVYDHLLTSIKSEYPDNKYVSAFEVVVNNLKKLPVGSKAPDINLTNSEGKQISLSSFKGKVVLIDFWASWCQPCRKENPHVVEIYRKYKNKNFEILGVSLDENQADWKAAIRKDRLAWPQVSDLKKWESGVVKSYQVEAIPFSVLVDKEGKIIAKGLTGNQLEEKLIEIL